MSQTFSSEITTELGTEDSSLTAVKCLGCRVQGIFEAAASFLLGIHLHNQTWNEREVTGLGSHRDRSASR